MTACGNGSRLQLKLQCDFMHLNISLIIEVYTHVLSRTKEPAQMLLQVYAYDHECD